MLLARKKKQWSLEDSCTMGMSTVAKMGFYPVELGDFGLGRKLVRPRYMSTAPTEPSDST